MYKRPSDAFNELYPVSMSGYDNALKKLAERVIVYEDILIEELRRPWIPKDVVKYPPEESDYYIGWYSNGTVRILFYDSINDLWSDTQGRACVTPDFYIDNPFE